MKIYKMTATFGKLEHETLTLEPGLNVIPAPNEWGKTTWSAFLITMLYGLDTRAKSTKTQLADKERYAPWSGSPMSGRIDLNWNGRDITIERSTKGRTPLGEFRAYETESGLEVGELTADTCGQLLLGVEQSVYRRTGFIRQSDMPVTQDEALRRRLNDLVTTGDETGDSDRLEQSLKDLKNKCRYNRTGLLPQAEARRAELEEKLAELTELETHSANLQERLAEVGGWIRSLENHRDAMAYAAAETAAQHVAEARALRDQAWQTAEQLSALCAGQPAREEVDRKIRAIEAYREELVEYQDEKARISGSPQMPATPAVFRDLSQEQAEQMVEQDAARYRKLSRKNGWRFLVMLAVVLLILCGATVWLGEYILAGLGGVLGLALLILGIRGLGRCRRGRRKLEEKYGSGMPEAWQLMWRNYAAEKTAYEQALLDYRVNQGDLDIRRTFLQKQRENLFADENPKTVLLRWKEMQKNWEDLADARQMLQQAEDHLQTLQEVTVSDVRMPGMEDILEYSPEETQTMLAEALVEQQRLQNLLGQHQGRMDTLGRGSFLRTQLQETVQRIQRLEETYAALTLALETLAQVRQELQRRFAPRIARRAQELLGTMTAGRYTRLTFREDMTVLASAQQEDTLRDVLWRSDGTVDQLYLALRLAVAEELIPGAPLVLDDAFVRFDNERLRAALEILKVMAGETQVILFTCQDREKTLLSQ